MAVVLTPVAVVLTLVAVVLTPLVVVSTLMAEVSTPVSIVLNKSIKSRILLIVVKTTVTGVQTTATGVKSTASGVKTTATGVKTTAFWSQNYCHLESKLLPFGVNFLAGNAAGSCI